MMYFGVENLEALLTNLEYSGWSVDQVITYNFLDYETKYGSMV